MTTAAERAWRIHLALAPDHCDSFRLLGAQESARGLATAGTTHIRRSVVHRSQYPDSWAEFGAALLHADMAGEAKVALKRGLSLQPTHDRALYNLGLAEHRSNSNRRASLLYSRALAIDSRHLDARRNRAATRRAAGDVEGAIGDYRLLIAAAPDQTAYCHGLAAALLDGGRLQEAAQLFTATALRQRRRAAASGPRRISVAQLRHDAEQLDYLLEQGRIAPALASIRDLYREMLARLPAATPAMDTVEMPCPDAAPPDWTLGPDAAPGSPVPPGKTLNPRPDAMDLTNRYRTGKPALAIIDDLLAPDTLRELRRFCLESRIWRHAHGGGYLGAFMEEGFFCPLLASIADELRLALPGIFGMHPLKKVWGFNYDNRLTGINLHADFAAINVNFWITPDDANLDPGSGGLVVWDAPAPLEWGFEDYNQSPERARAYLEANGARPMVVPYRANRAVVFDSNLFHETDRFLFKPGYENRRINITLLYGLRS
ncbi:MAG: tetratricopeptide repeat protein [Proteobacteria bacterium]|nr:tetratricopeptide repeat protein [Pseudomonadota bacterium]